MKNWSGAVARRTAAGAAGRVRAEHAAMPAPATVKARPRMATVRETPGGGRNSVRTEGPRGGRRLAARRGRKRAGHAQRTVAPGARNPPLRTGPLDRLPAWSPADAGLNQTEHVSGTRFCSGAVLQPTVTLRRAAALLVEAPTTHARARAARDHRVRE